MKKMNRILAAFLCLTLLLAASGCGGGSGGENTPPAISGVRDQDVVAGSEFDALAGVTASDEQDGDITSMITIISMPSLTFQNGKATPESAGTYELTYSVTDKGGETAEAYATLTVTRQTGEATILQQMDFSTASIDSRGWEASIAEGVNASGELRDGAFVFDITDAGSGDGDIQLKKAGVALNAADYRVKIWAKSTKDTYAHILARDENAADWSTFGGAFNVRIGTEIAPLELNFTSSGEGSAELILNLGKITPNLDNPSDATPEDFTVTVDKIELYEITGNESPVPVCTNDFAMMSIDAVALSAGDGASGSASCSGDGTGVFQVDGYPTSGGVWSIKADIALAGASIEAGQKYYYSYTLKTENAQTGELVVESASQNDAARATLKIMVAVGDTPTSFEKLAGWDITPPAELGQKQDFRDPQAYLDPDTGNIILTVTASQSGTARILKYTLSPDLENAHYDGIIFTNPVGDFWNLECSDTFKIGDTWYITYSAQDDTLWYATSDAPYGPYGDPVRLDGKLFYAAKHVEDGENAYMVGWARRSESVSSTQDVAAWAGNLAVQKLVQTADGALALAPVDSIAESFSVRRALAIEDTHALVQSGSAYSYADAFTCYESFMLTGEFTFTGEGSFGLSFDYNGRNDKNKFISISPADGMLRLQFNEGSTLITETAIDLEPGETYSFTYIQEGSVGIFYIDGMASLTVRLYGASGKTIQLFAENNTVLFTSLREYTRP